MRDCIFLLADRNMAAVFTGFLTRDGFQHSLQVSLFQFDPEQDILVDAAGNDPGVYTRAHEILRSYINRYQYAVVVLDEAWEGSPGAEGIKTHISNNLRQNGWSDDRFVVCVIVPELEAWIWQDSIHVASAFRYNNFAECQQWLHTQGMWPENDLKPPAPKEAIEQVLRIKCIPRSSAIYRRIMSAISIRGCADPAFLQLHNILQGWFPLQHTR